MGAGLLFFLAVGAWVEVSPHFKKTRKLSRAKAVSMGFFDYGSLGRVLKDMSALRVVPEDEKSVLLGNLQKNALLTLDMTINADAKVQVYWAGEDHQYREKDSFVVLSKKGQDRYYFILSNLANIKWLRIDPADRPARAVLKSVFIEQKGFEPIRIETKEALRGIVPLHDIKKTEYKADGMHLWISGNDAHLELSIQGKKVIQREKKYFTDILFPKKRGFTENLYRANPGGAEAFPSSRIVNNALLTNPLPLLSVAIDDAFLQGRKLGIIRNWWHRGRRWERLAYVSYYEKGRLKFATSAGLRLHGQSTRKAGINFRLHFRKEYGMSKIAPGLLFGTHAPPIKRLAVVTDRSNPRFNNCMAFDIARRIGCITPEIKPVRFLLNGKPPIDIAYFMVEHLNKKQWAKRMGHEDFVFYRLKNRNNTPEDKAAYARLIRRFKDKNPLSLDAVAKEIDIENLTRFVLATVFCGNWDYKQGAAVLDKRKKDARWFWVMWDMDVSFLDLKRWGFAGELWQQRGFPLVGRDFDFRMYLFSRLMRESSDYRRYFVRFFTDMLNHRLTPAFFRSRIDRYDRISKALFGERPYFEKKKMEVFFKKRPDYLRYELDKYFGDLIPIGKSIPCRVFGPAGLRYRIDGFPEKPGYQGQYFKGQTVHVQMEGPLQDRLLYWRVNGRKYFDRRLALPVQEETRIEPVFVSPH